MQEETCNHEWLKHLDLLIQHLKKVYKSISEHLVLLLRYKKISYDLLWALFKSDMLVYMTCLATDLLRCVKYNFDEEKRIAQEVDYFEIQNHYFDFDDEIFDEVMKTVQIEMFCKIKQIENLLAHSFNYHSETMIKKHLVKSDHWSQVHLFDEMSLSSVWRKYVYLKQESTFQMICEWQNYDWCRAFLKDQI